MDTPPDTVGAPLETTGNTSAGVTSTLAVTGTPTAQAFSTDPDPLQVEVMRRQAYPGSAITFEQTLPPSTNYTQYIVSYMSDGYNSTRA